MLTWTAWDRVTSDLARLAAAVGTPTPNSWEQWFRYVRHDAEAFLTGPTRPRARAAENMLREWFKDPNRASGWLQSRQNKPMQMSSHAMKAMRTLAADVDDYLNGRALLSLRTEAPRVLAQFSSAMPDAYSLTLSDTFVRIGPLRHPHLLFHETRQDFETHYNNNFRRPGLFPAVGVKAFCTPVYNQYPDFAELSAKVAPQNRVIELPPDYADDSVAHELLHWATHERYEDESRSHQDFANKVIIEGVTEYFSRVIHPSRTSYPDELDVVRRAITDRAVTDATLRSAYFGGTGVAGVMTTLAAAAAAASARADADAQLQMYDWWRQQLQSNRTKQRAASLSRGLTDFLNACTDAQLDKIISEAGVRDPLASDIKRQVAAKRTPSPVP